MQRHLFVYEDQLLICKQQSKDNSINEEMCEHSSIMVDGKEQVYSSKKNVKVKSLTNLSLNIMTYAFN